MPMELLRVFGLASNVKHKSLTKNTACGCKVEQATKRTGNAQDSGSSRNTTSGNRMEIDEGKAGSKKPTAKKPPPAIIC